VRQLGLLYTAPGLKCGCGRGFLASAPRRVVASLRLRHGARARARGAGGQAAGGKRGARARAVTLGCRGAGQRAGLADDASERGRGGGEKGKRRGRRRGRRLQLVVAERGERRRGAERAGASGEAERCGGRSGAAGEAEHCGRSRALRGRAEALGLDRRRRKRKADGRDLLVSHPGGR
jgi:hypothetical protein